MKLVSAKCPNCGVNINIDRDSKIIKCEYCNASIIVEDDKLEIQKEETKQINNKEFKTEKPKKKKSIKIYLILFAVILAIAYAISVKISWDYKNSLGAVVFPILGLCYLTFIKESRLQERALILADVFGLVFYFAALWFSLFIYNLLPGYVNEWENENIKLTIEREEATVEFKNTGMKETAKYSTNTINGVTTIKILDYEFIYAEEKDNTKMCYAKEDKCIEELKLVE